MSRIVLYSIMLICLVFDFHTSKAQTSRLFRLKPDQETKHTTWRDSVYRFKEFMPGRLTYIVGKSQPQKFNYNLFSEKVQFINDKGDTLDVHESKELRLVMIGGKVFYYHYQSGYIEILLQLPLALGVKQGFYVARKETVANDGYSTTILTTSSVASYKGLPQSATNYADNLYEKKAVYFFIDQQNRLYRASKSAILRIFQNNTKEIKAFCKVEKINFQNQKDLINLIKFCNRFY